MPAQILDPNGRPVTSSKPDKVDTSTLTREIGGASTVGVRSPISGYPADGLEPERLGSIMRQVDAGNPLEYFELAELMEERDLHYVGVLGTRKRIVSQTEVTVEAASDKREDVAKADMIRTWLKRDTLQIELFHILDAVGKGISFTEIIWDSSTGQWQPSILKYQSPRFFNFARHDLDTPLLREVGGDVPLPPMKFITARMPMKSGLTIRSGLARVVAWAYMFKMFSQKDWAIFLQSYGQPIRIGKYQTGASEEDKRVLFNAVMNIAADCAAVIPAGMMIEFIESKTADKSGQLYLERVNFLDQQVSKAVLGQTATTDAIAGGHAVGREHREVQKDIKQADCGALAAILNRDLVKPWIDLEYGPQAAYPRLIIRDPEDLDLAAFSTAIDRLAGRGLLIPQNWVRDRVGIPEPAAGEATIGGAPMPEDEGKGAGPFPQPAAKPALQSAAAPPAGAVDDVLALMGADLDEGAELIIEHIRGLAAEATSLQDLQAKLMMTLPDVPERQLAEALRQAMALASLAGIADARAGQAAGSETGV